MARPNYSFKKRQKELKRQKKKEEKMQRRLAKKAGDVDEVPEGGGGEDTPETDGMGAESDTATDPDNSSRPPDGD